MKAFWLALLILILALLVVWFRKSEPSPKTSPLVRTSESASPIPTAVAAPRIPPPVVRFIEVAPEAPTTPPQEVTRNDVDVEIAYPKPLYVSPPRPVAKLPNLEPPGSIPIIRSFSAPTGTANVALNKPVTSSDPSPIIGALTLVTDGNADGQDGNFVELAPGPQWVQIDLASQVSVFKIAMWHYHKSSRAYVDVLVQVSGDPEFREGVTTLFNSDHDNTLGMGAGADPTYIETHHGRLIDGRGTVARYVRLTSNGNTADELNHYCEVAVYGVPGG